MLKDKRSLERYLAEQCDIIVLNNDICKEIYKYANKKYGIPKGTVSDFVTKRVELSKVTEFDLFILLDAIYNICVSVEKKYEILSLDNFYTNDEIKYYEKQNYKIKKIEFPLEFKMISVAEGQWIGKITVETLMKLRRAQLINYNTETQRVMQKIVNKEKIDYRIALNKKAINEIEYSFDKGKFIPNTITLNIPDDVNVNYFYDENTCTFVINSIDHFDMIDGYHRYIAACRVKDRKEAFDYPLELRIVAFSENKAQQFIFQEDQKTKMRKIDSDSMNANKASNITTKKINENPDCYFEGLIGRNEAIIPFSELTELINYFYFKGIKKEKERTIIIQTVKELTAKFNMLVTYNQQYLEQKMSKKTLLIIMFCFYYFKDSDEAFICQAIDKLIQKTDTNKVINERIKKSKMPLKILVEELENIVEGGL